MRKSSLLALALVLVVGTVAAPLHAQATGRVSATVLDTEGEPLAGVQVTVTTAALPTFEETKTTNKKGKFTLGIADATQVYQFKLQKEGYETAIAEVKPNVGGTTFQTFTLPRRGEAPAQPGQPVQQAPVRDPAISAFNEGVEAQTLGNLELAEQKYREALDKDDELAPAWAALSAVHLLQERFDEAASASERALELDPENFQALNVRFEAYRRMGNEEMADQAFEALEAAGDAADVGKRIFNEGVEAYQAGNTELAKARFQEALDLDPTLTAAYGALATIYMQEENWALAQEMSERLLEQDPDDVKAMRIRFDAARLSGDADAMNESLDRLAVEDPEWVTGDLYSYAVEQFNAGQYAAAAPILERVIEIDENHARAHYVLALASFNTGRTERAKPLLERYLELAPDDPDAEAAREMLRYLE